MDFLATLTSSLAEFGAVLDGTDLVAPVPTCGDWTVYDLVDHLGRGNLWVATAVREKHGGGGGDDHRAPAAESDLRVWFDETVDAITTALAAAPETAAWTFTTQQPQTVGFWRRRRAHETVMHLWDLRNAFGAAEEEPIDPALAADGVTEVFEMFAQRMISRGLAAEPEAAVRVAASDTGDVWTHGPGEPVAGLTATAGDLLLGLWGRKPRSGTGFTWSGDVEAGRAALAGPLVP
jgi:uncharacterized protein (TIGR03083 family)